MAKTEQSKIRTEVSSGFLEKGEHKNSEKQKKGGDKHFENHRSVFLNEELFRCQLKFSVAKGNEEGNFAALMAKTCWLEREKRKTKTVEKYAGGSAREGDLACQLLTERLA